LEESQKEKSLSSNSAYRWLHKNLSFDICSNHWAQIPTRAALFEFARETTQGQHQKKLLIGSIEIDIMWMGRKRDKEEEAKALQEAAQKVWKNPFIFKFLFFSIKESEICITAVYTTFSF
jgi:hypothetical protein